MEKFIRTNKSTTQTMSKTSNPKEGRVVIILGGKGGIGKTLLAATLADFYTEQKVHYIAIDADTENNKHGSLAHLIGCPKLDIRGKVGLDALIDHALSGPDLVLVDFGAGTVTELAKWIGQVGQALAQENVSLTIAAMITSELATVDATLRCAEQVTDKAVYVLVENPVKGEVTDSVNNPQLQQFIKVAEPAQIKLELLRSDIALELDRVGQSPRGAQREPASDLLKTASVRIRLNAWRSEIDSQLSQTTALLPL